MKFTQGSLFAFPDGLLPVGLVYPQHFRHRYLFHQLSSFGAVNLSEKTNEVVPSLYLSCSGHV